MPERDPSPSRNGVSFGSWIKHIDRTPSQDGKKVAILFTLDQQVAFVVTCLATRIKANINTGWAWGRYHLNETFDVSTSANRNGVLTVSELEDVKLDLTKGRQKPNNFPAWHLSSWIPSWIRKNKHIIHPRWLPVSIPRHFFELHGKIGFGSFKWFGQDVYQGRTGPYLTGYTLYVLVERSTYKASSLGLTIRVSDRQAQRLGHLVSVAYIEPNEQTDERKTYIYLHTGRKPLLHSVTIIPKFALDTQVVSIRYSGFHVRPSRQPITGRNGHKKLHSAANAGAYY